ncbi:MAG: phosphotransferase [bacterium]
MDLVILAGGKGRRFGTAKQFVPVAPDGATLLEVTARDARRAGCDRAVIVTAPGSEDEVLGLFAARPVAGLEIIAVPQRLDDLPGPAPARDRPWGTAHALWAARSAVTGPFLLFNADDHYGPNAPAVLAAALMAAASGPRFVMLGFPLGATLSGSGTVSRAVCTLDDRGRLTGMREYTAVDPHGRVAEGDGEGAVLPSSAVVSMNAWGFTPAVFPLVEEALQDFLREADHARRECFLPAVIDRAVRSGRCRVSVVSAPDRWCGLTWPEDRPRVTERLAELAALEEAVAAFGLAGGIRPPAPFGTGLVHATWTVDGPAGGHLVQRVNETVFPDPVLVAENAAAAAVRIDDALRRCGDTDPRHRLVYRPGDDGKPWFRDGRGGIWRCLVRVVGARPADPGIPAETRAAARLLGRFPGLVEHGEGPALRETLPGFHDTEARLAAFRSAVEADVHGRLTGCRPECDRLLRLAPLAGRLAAMGLPPRPIHNDAKPDNVLVDTGTGEALCVIDLDTVMPGIAPHDFGDLVRAAVTGRPEDEPDPARITLREGAFRELAGGYLAGAREWITPPERAALVDGALVITYEQALRFLGDHLAGDVYYRTEGPGHNLRRARAQLRLLELLVDAEQDLRDLVAGL